MKFPVTIRHRDARVKIYAPSGKFASYRIYYRFKGKAVFRGFASYGIAKAAAEKAAKKISQGSAAPPTFSTRATNDALAALERLDELFRATGKRVSLLAAVSDYAEAVKKLGRHSLSDAVSGFLANTASVKRRAINEAVAEFLTSREPLTKAKEGQRSQLSSKYHYNLSILLNKFADAFPGHAVCDLAREHVDTYFGEQSVLSPKSRNHRRATISAFLRWAVSKDYLPASHRLLEADTMRPEKANLAEVQFYTPKEFRALLESADASLLPLLVIGGLAGLRTAELLRLDWADVWRVPGHIEVTAGKSKTRQRRLVEMVPSLAAWHEPYRGRPARSGLGAKPVSMSVSRPSANRSSSSAGQMDFAIASARTTWPRTTMRTPPRCRLAMHRRCCMRTTAPWRRRPKPRNGSPSRRINPATSFRWPHLPQRLEFKS